MRLLHFLSSQTLSLEGANAIDQSAAERKEAGEPIPHDKFKPILFRQPSLAEGKLKPAAYRKYRSATTGKNVSLGVRVSDLSNLEEAVLSPNSRQR